MPPRCLRCGRLAWIAGHEDGCLVGFWRALFEVSGRPLYFAMSFWEQMRGPLDA